MMILKPWLEHWKVELQLPETRKALLLLDVFKAHQTPGVQETLLASGFICNFVPANCTSELQPNDLALNAP